MKIKKLLGYKTLGEDATASTRNMMNWGNFVSDHNMCATTIATTFASSETALKIIHIYV